MIAFVVACLGIVAQLGDGPLQGVRLNDRLAPGQDVNVWSVSPDGTQVYHVVTEPVFDAGQLLVSRIDGAGHARALTPQLPSGRDIRQMGASPDNQHAVYVADQDTLGVFELYSVRGDGTQPAVKLSGAVTAGGNVFPLLFFTPDGTRVVFMADTPFDGRLKTYSAPTDGSAPALALGGPVRGLPQLSPDGAWVVFEWFGLNSVPTDGSAPPARIDGLPGTPEIDGFELSADGQWAVFLETITTPEGERTYSTYAVPLAGGATPVLLFDPILGRASSPKPLFHISPDSLWVVFRNAPNVFYPGPRELFAVPIDGSAAPTRISPPIAAGPGPSADFRFGPGGSLVFGFQTSAGSSPALYVAPQDGSGTPLALTGTSPVPDVLNFQVSPRNRVVFLADVGGRDELFSVPLDASSVPVRLNAPLVAGGEVFNGVANAIPSFVLSSDGGQVLYMADQDIDTVVELYVTSIAGGEPVRKLSRPARNGSAYSPFFTASGQYVVYGSDHNAPGQHGVFGGSVPEGPSAGASSPLPGPQKIQR